MIEITGGLLIMGATWAALVIGWFLVDRTCQFVVGIQGELRDHFADPGWRPAGQDAVLLPLWLVVELLCFVGSMLAALLFLVIAYQGAKAVRDWWQAGARKR
jgi:hypothetical protein